MEQVANNIPDIIYVLDLSAGKFTFTNGRVKEIMGAENILLDKIHPDDQEARRKHLAACLHLKKNEMRDIDMRMKVRAGAWHWFRVRDLPFKFDYGGRVTHTLGVARDIQEDKIKEAELAKKEDMLQRVLNAQTVGLVAYKAVRDARGEICDYEFILTSKAFEEFHQRKDLIGKLVFAEYPQIRDTVFDSWRRIIETGRPLFKEEQFPSPLTGKTHRFHLKYEKLEDGLLVFWEEITHEKQEKGEPQSQYNLLEAVFKASPYSICALKSIKDHADAIIDFEFTAVNSCAGGQIGQRFLDARPDLRGSELFARFARVAETGVSAEWSQIYDPSGKNGWCFIKVVAYNDGIVCTVTELASLLPEMPGANPAQRPLAS